MDSYLEFLQSWRMKYPTLEEFPFETEGLLSINRLPIFALSILRSIAIENSQKIIFYETFLKEYMINKRKYENIYLVKNENI